MIYQQHFIAFIQKGKLEEIQSFYEQYKLHIHSKDAFIYACFAFIYDCFYGHLAVAQWLYQIKPTIDISTRDEHTFRGACGRGHLELAQWLQTLIPYGLYYTFEVDENNKITSYSTEKLNYSFLQKRLDIVHSGNEICFREALVRNRFHPKYMDKWVDWGHEEAEDFDMMA